MHHLTCCARRRVVEHEIQNSHTVNRFQRKVLGAGFGLLPNREGQTEHRAVFGIVLLDLLQLHDELLSRLVFAVNVEYDDSLLKLTGLRY